MARKARKTNSVSLAKTEDINMKRKNVGAVIYVGPPIKGTLLHSTFTIFADGIPAEYRGHPTLKHLFVPPDRLDQARREIGRKGSLRNTYYKRAIEETKQNEGK